VVEAERFLVCGMSSSKEGCFFEDLGAKGLLDVDAIVDGVVLLE